MDCSDPQYAPGYALDYADNNTIRDNVFQNVTFGVRVEDDGNTIADNQFSGDAAQQAIVLGTPNRTATLNQPVTNTTITGNTSAIPTNPNPYRWVHGQTNTTFTDNLSLGRSVGLCEGVPPARGPFVMTVALVGQAEAPTDPPAPIPTPGPRAPAPSRVRARRLRAAPPSASPASTRRRVTIRSRSTAAWWSRIRSRRRWIRWFGWRRRHRRPRRPPARVTIPGGAPTR
jgi:parallel beta-helix repeat protein